MKIIALRRVEQNQAAVDPWTAVHLSAGLALGLLVVPLRWALAAAAAYELVEQAFERCKCGQEFFETCGPESLPNALVDTAVFLAGHWLGQKWSEK